MRNRRIVLASRPTGEATPENFRLEAGALGALVLLRATGAVLLGVAKTLPG